MTHAEISSLEYFTEEEITNTGACISDVQFLLFQKMEKLRTYLNRRIRLLHNGLTTGTHASREHRQGCACDFYLDPRDGKTDYYFVFKCAIDAGFNKIGVYWNGTAYSFHVAFSAKSSFWLATKKKKGDSWTFGALLRDPAEVLNKAI